MTELLIRLTLLLFVGLAANYLLRRMEPSWRLAVFRFGFIAVMLLAVTALVKPAWNLPVLEAPAQAAIPAVGNTVTTDPVMETSSPAVVVNYYSELTVSLLDFFLYLWALVAVVLLAQQIFTHIRLAAEVRKLQAAPAGIQNLWDAICREFGAKPTIVKVATENSSPCLSLRGELILPRELYKNFIQTEALSHVLRHEAAHLAGKDNLWLPASAALTKVIWFHPLAWWFNASHLRACEDTRDAEAARLGGAKQYRSTLAKLALDWLPVQGATAGLFRRKSDLLRRLKAVEETVDQQPASISAKLAVGALTLALGAMFGGIVLVPQNSFAGESVLTGIWTTTDPNTRYAKKLEVVEGEESTILKLWYSNGKGINPSPEIVEFPSGSSVENGISKDYGFKIQTYALESTRKGLSLHTTTTYTDDSGRKNRKDEWTFTRVAGATKRVNDGAGDQGWAGFWKNEDEGSQGTLQLEIADNKLRVWGRQGREISREPVSESELTIAENTATTTVDHGFAKRTITLKKQRNGRLKVRVETDYTDPKRHDQEHVWLFERGKFQGARSQ